MQSESRLTQFMIRLGGSGWLIRLLIAVLAIINIVALFGLFVPSALETGNQREIRIALIYPAVIVLGMGGLILYQWFAIRRGSEAVHQAISPMLADLQLKRDTFTRDGVRYQGEINGRELHIHVLSPGATPKARPYVGIYLSTTVGTRQIIIGRAHSMAEDSGDGFKTLTFGDPDLKAIRAVTLDSGWTKTIMKKDNIKEVITRLAGNQHEERPELLFLQPDALGLEAFFLNTDYEDERMLVDKVNKAMFSRWLTDLTALADLLESAPAPTVTDQTSAVERALRLNPHVMRPANLMLGLLVVDVVLWLIVLILNG